MVPKNATMGSVLTPCGFDMQPVVTTDIAFEKDGVLDTDGILAITGSDFGPPNTIVAHVLDTDIGLSVEVRAGESSAHHAYSASMTGFHSKQARIYVTGGDQMYGVDWDTGGQIWCARCAGHDTFDVVIPGDLLCKQLDECGCVADGFDIVVLDATLDTMPIPPHLRGLHSVSSPLDTTGTVGIDAMVDPSISHPAIVVKMEKGTVSWDDGSIVNLHVSIDYQLTSAHSAPDGTHDTRTGSITVNITDPWAWGTLEPTYETRCGCTPIYD